MPRLRPPPAAYWTPYFTAPPFENSWIRPCMLLYWKRLQHGDVPILVQNRLDIGASMLQKMQ